VLLGSKFSKLNELFCNYKEISYVQKYTFNLQEMYAVHNLEDCIGKEELYLRKTTIVDA
jgi:hypothetical protein